MINPLGVGLILFYEAWCEVKQGTVLIVAGNHWQPHVSPGKGWPWEANLKMVLNNSKKSNNLYVEFWGWRSHTMVLVDLVPGENPPSGLEWPPSCMWYIDSLKHVPESLILSHKDHPDLVWIVWSLLKSSSELQGEYTLPCPPLLCSYWLFSFPTWISLSIVKALLKWCVFHGAITDALDQNWEPLYYAPLIYLKLLC